MEEVFADADFQPPKGFKEMPVYPRRFTVLRLDLRGLRRRLGWALRG
ncbi:MAG TPA: hypothetical protein VNW54_05250 [Granulicella sp.]|jgi:hypothetical protein|nr:hypothetical protein [Granulicella sp.]